MPVPEPNPDESQDDFMSRCMSDLADEFEDSEQRSAVCFGAWRDAQASQHSQIPRDDESREDFIARCTAAGESEQACKVVWEKVHMSAKNGLRLIGQCQISTEVSTPESPMPRFEMRAYSGGSFYQPWVHEPIVIDLSSLRVPTETIPVHRDHEASKIVGHVTSVNNKHNRLDVSGVVSAGNEHAEEVLVAARNGFPWQSSLGIPGPLDLQWIGDDEAVEVNGRQFVGPMYVARNTVLREVSVTSVGADFTTWTSFRMKGKVMDEKQDGEKGEKDDGASNVHKELKGKVVDDKKVDDSASKVRQDLAAAYRLQSLVEKHLAGYPDLKARALEEQWTEDRMQLEALRAERSKAPAVHIQSSSEATASGESIACALWMASGHDPEVGGFAAPLIEVTRKAAPKSAGLKWALHQFIRANGGYVHSGVMDDEVIRTAVTINRNLQLQGFSNTVLTNILANVANKAMLQAYENPAAIAEQVCAVVEHVDFKQYSRMRMLGGGELVVVPPGGEIPHGELDEEVYTHQLATRGLMLVLTRQQIINDDLQALMDLGTNLGNTAVRSREKLVFTTLQDNSDTFFQTSPTFATAGYRSNQMTGALTPGNLITAEKKFWAQTDKLNNPILVAPQILLVPTTLKHDAVVLTQMRTVNVRDGVTTLQKTSTSDASTFADQLRVEGEFQGAFKVLATPWLTAQADPANGDDDAWYLLANPGELAAMELAYLRGSRAPTLENADTEFNTLGIQWRIFWDLSAKHRNPRAAVRSTGP